MKPKTKRCAGKIEPSSASFFHPLYASQACRLICCVLFFLGLLLPGRSLAQTLINVDFGVGKSSPKTGWAATGQSTNDFWNLYRHYDPKFSPGMPLVTNGSLAEVKFSDGSASPVSISVSNAPGVWGNTTGDAMLDSYLFSMNGSNITATVSNLPAGRYHFYLYGHADADVTGEQNSLFTIESGTNRFGPLTSEQGNWKASINEPGIAKRAGGLRDGYPFALFRDVQVFEGVPVILVVSAGPNGVPVLNGMQIASRGTSPPGLAAVGPILPVDTATNLLFREVRYEGTVTDDEARFHVKLTVESRSTNEIAGMLFEGDVAILNAQMPDKLRMMAQPKGALMVASAPGVYEVSFDAVVKIQRAEPWNQITLIGPPAAIASVNARAAGADVEMQLLSGTLVDLQKADKTSEVHGLIGPDRTLSLRWQSKAAEVQRKSFVTVDTLAGIQITPTVVRFNTLYKYDILQATMARLVISLPTNQNLIRLQGEQIRDWRVTPDKDASLLTVEFLKPIEKTYQLTLLSEQTVESTSAAQALEVPRPQKVERESGSINLVVDDTVAEVQKTEGLRQVNTPAGAVASYRFNARPFSLTARIRRIEPLIEVSDRVTARLEESRFLVDHSMNLQVTKAGVYSIELSPQTGFAVANVSGEGVDDWKLTDGKLRVNFTSRVLGTRPLRIQLEQALKEFPARVVVDPLRLAGAATETAEIGAGALFGLRVKTAELAGLREIPIDRLSQRTDELLAYQSDQAAWRLTLATERLAPRVVADVFNLVTVGDGLVGGSATMRFGIINQGVREFHVKVPAHWKNVDFTGPGIRRKEQLTNDWIIGLQDKAWGGYTLVITYDYPFDPKGAVLAVGGVHAVDVERETGSIALTSSSGLRLDARPVSEPLRRIDEMELAAEDRALIMRPVMLAYQYTGAAYDLTLDVARYEPARMLEAVADRTQLTTVVTEAGQMLTQASFMVKNNEKQFQRFRLPEGAQFWSSFVNDNAVKAERDGDWVLVPLPRQDNRDATFAVDLVYAQKMVASGAMRAKAVSLEAPRTDIPNTYAEWQIYAPKSRRLSGFGGTMTIAQGTVYGWQEAWNQFFAFYVRMEKEMGFEALFFGGLFLLLLVMIVAFKRRGFRGLASGLAVFGLMLLLGAMLLPALSKSKSSSAHLTAIGGRNPGRTDVNGPVSAVDTLSLEDRKSVADGSVVGVELKKKDSAQDHFQVIPERPAIVPVTPVPSQAPAATPAPVASETQQHGFGLVNTEKETAGLIGGGGGGIGGFAGRAMVPMGKVVESGINPIRIEIPREGRSYLFTKVLNVGGEPLTVHARDMDATGYLVARGILETVAFLAGLILVWMQWRKPFRNAFRLTVGVVLSFGAVAHLLIAWRVLHLGLIVLAPLIVLFILIWIVWRIPGRKAVSAGNGVPPMLALLAMLLWPMGASAQPTGAAATNAVSITSAIYRGEVRGQVAAFDVALRVQTFRTNTLVRLFGPEVAVQQFSSDTPSVQLVRDGTSVCADLGGANAAGLSMKIMVKIGGEVTQRQLAFGIPPSLYSQFVLDIDEPDVEVEVPTAISVKRANLESKTHVEAIIGPGAGVDLRWTPRVKRAAEIAATIFCENTSLVTLGNSVAGVRSVLDYQITQGELRRASVRLPAGQRLVRVEGEMVRTWEQRDDGYGSVAVIELLKGVSANWRLTLETEKPLDPLPAFVKVLVPHAMEVQRETGVVALAGAEELGLNIDAPALQRVDGAEFEKIVGHKVEGLAGAFRFLKPDFNLSVSVEVIRPEIEAVVHNRVTVGSDQTVLAAQVDYQIKKAGVFSLRLLLPKDYRVEKTVGSKGAINGRVLPGTDIYEANLGERVLGACTIRMTLTKSGNELPKHVNIVGVHPLDTAKLAGFVSVFSELGVVLKTEVFEGLSEIPATGLPALLQESQEAGGRSIESAPEALSGSTLAFKRIATQPGNIPDWKLVVTAEQVEPWIRAEIVNTYNITDTLVNGRAIARFEIANAPIRELKLNIPKAFKNVEIAGANIRRRDQEGEQWRVELQGKTRGMYFLTITWEQPRSSQTNAMELEGVSVTGVERETGMFAIVARPPLQVLPQSMGDMLKADPRELPEWAGRPDAATVLAFRYLRPGAKLLVDVKRFEEVSVLQALVDNGRFTTVVAEDGQTMTEMVLALRNNGRQHLELELPNGAQVWSAFVGGQPAQPSRRDGRILLPVERSAAGSRATISVELIYVNTNKFPGLRGSLDLVSPKFDVPLKNIRWELYLPPNYTYSEFGGSMNIIVPEVVFARSLSSVDSRYSIDEYKRQETQKQEVIQSEVKFNLQNAQEKLAEGNIKEAVENYRQIRSGKQGSVAAEPGIKKLEKDLRRVQSSNLLARQNTFSAANGVVMDAQMDQSGQNVAASRNSMLFYNDATMAEQQWSKLQQAQEVTVAQIQPLRVNLPIRGAHYEFSQVLQTETGKPMIIHLMAARLGAGGFIEKAVILSGAFLVLWLMLKLLFGTSKRPGTAGQV
jgi:hypothetical protein